jgi:ribosomal protein S27AE
LTTASAPPASLPASTTALAARLASPEELELVPIADSPAAGQPAAADLHAESRSVPESKKARPPEAAARQLRVLGVKGGVLSSQDGTRVKFRKTCLRCGYADTSMTTMPIRSGVTRANFFCPKCKKSQQVEVQGVG